jgi:hypothetical protein
MRHFLYLFGFYMHYILLLIADIYSLTFVPTLSRKRVHSRISYRDKISIPGIIWKSFTFIVARVCIPCASMIDATSISYIWFHRGLYVRTNERNISRLFVSGYSTVICVHTYSTYSKIFDSSIFFFVLTAMNSDIFLVVVKRDISPRESISVDIW